MAKTNSAPVEKVKQIVLTQEQFEKLSEIRSLLDNASDTLNNIDGDENTFAIGRMVGDATSDLIKAFNDLGDIVDELDVNNYYGGFESGDDFEDEKEEDDDFEDEN
jgi:hypothetical protein